MKAAEKPWIEDRKEVPYLALPVTTEPGDELLAAAQGRRHRN